MPRRADSHPTRERLIETMTAMLDETPQDLKVETLLARSGVSIGSLYHHFENLDDLIEVAYSRRFAESVDASVGRLAQIVETAQTKEQVLDALKAVTRATQDPERRSTRMERSRILAMAAESERFAEVLKVEQQRLTDALTDLVREAQERGWYSKDFDPQAAAVLIQAYSLGVIVDDFSERPVDPDKWIALIDRLIERTFAD